MKNSQFHSSLKKLHRLCHSSFQLVLEVDELLSVGSRPTRWRHGAVESLTHWARFIFRSCSKVTAADLWGENRLFSDSTDMLTVKRIFFWLNTKLRNRAVNSRKWNNFKTRLQLNSWQSNSREDTVISLQHTVSEASRCDRATVLSQRKGVIGEAHGMQQQ